eukprot:CAMPEP_0182940026 /NCGR_PEP_ID=MMETSP0105_2-20130417/46632_1 /TAXON_ID=81532 ORGANISM="Acanthoeca-like sp., Strain 10tr" /NCGR_SAMPLE_ID=MMETSP0105_2 /ASSEMBLY_ACC=CAM_ASM_000205 /LENGTH=60 /DNA_ID=CAMNT_0025079485 /DNA_START=84 /DNA_END=263 /DNA_ORIENTATION=+
MSASCESSVNLCDTPPMDGMKSMAAGMPAWATTPASCTADECIRAHPAPPTSGSASAAAA